MMISILLIILAGICNAIMDKLQFGFHSSIFKKLNQQFWNPTFSWKNKWNTRFPKLTSTIFVMFTDAWHLFKYLMVMYITLSIVFYQPIVNWYVDIAIINCAFTCTFELFYSKILVYGNQNK